MEITPVPHPSPALSRGRVVGALLVLGPVIVLVLLPSVLGLHRYVVADDAMAGDRDGSIARGSVALTREVPASDLHVGDVITFRPPVQDGFAPGSTVTRRITSIDDGVATTRGDGQGYDPWELDISRSTFPRVVFAVPWLGYPFTGNAGQGGWVLMVAAAIVALLVAAFTPWRQRRQRRLAHRGVVYAPSVTYR